MTDKRILHGATFRYLGLVAAENRQGNIFSSKRNYERKDTDFLVVIATISPS
jgi:hypothetical protein